MRKPKRFAFVAAVVGVAGAAAVPVISSASPPAAASSGAPTTVKTRAVALTPFRPGAVISTRIPGHVVEWQWYRCEQHLTDCEKIRGAIHSRYRIRMADVGHILRVRAVVAAPSGRTTTRSVATPVIGLPAPVNVSLPTISGVAQEGQTLTGSPGTWRYALRYTYQWEDCGTTGANCAPISGATAPTYLLQASDVGYTIVLVVTAYNYMAPGASTK